MRRKGRSTRVSMLLAVAMVAVLSLGALAGCGNSSGELRRAGRARPTPRRRRS
ncbi:MAG: hypothetical protein ACLT98_04330 [Eggerthellaceae bacterium]